MTTPVYEDTWIRLYHGDNREVLATLPDQSVHMCMTSPPYFGLRSYLDDEDPDKPMEIGREQTPDEYVQTLVEVFRAVRRVLRDDGTLWLNLGDSYANDAKWGGASGGKHTKALHGESGIGREKRHTGLKSKDLIGIPWRVALALQADGWYLRNAIVWNQPNAMPESVTDRFTNSYEMVFLLTKQTSYFFDQDAVREPHTEVTLNRIRYGLKHSHPDGIGYAIPPVDTDEMGERFAHPLGRNRRDVWTVPTGGYPGAHYAVFPSALVEPCIKAGCPPDGIVLDPFAGSGTVGKVAQSLSRRAVLIDLNGEYLQQQLDRNAQVPLGL